MFIPISKITFLAVLTVLVSSCSERSQTENAEGSVSVQIPVQTSAASYQLKLVDLLGVKDLKKVSGDYAKFYYAPGLNGSELVGSSPVAHFIKSGSSFVPSDFTSTQMATIYYHMQKLAQLDQEVGAGSINHWPRSVGLETQIMEKDGSRKNNAFYDGQTDAMMFVPFTNTELPIAVNAGIIAHEHFHSLFYKIVIRKAVAAKKIRFDIKPTHPEPVLIEAPKTIRPPNTVADKTKVNLYNEVYIRGINEGFADFWGWVYTEDANFMKWSLPTFIESRTLSLENQAPGEYLTQQNIENEITDLMEKTDQPRSELINYYRIGTPHARFLKQWVSLYSNQESISVAEAKVIVAQKVVTYLYELKNTVSALEEGQTIKANNFFTYFAGKERLDPKLNTDSCEFLVSYLNFETTDANAMQKCIQNNNQVTIEKSAPPAAKKKLK